MEQLQLEPQISALPPVRGGGGFARRLADLRPGGPDSRTTMIRQVVCEGTDGFPDLGRCVAVQRLLALHQVGGRTVSEPRPAGIGAGVPVARCRLAGAAVHDAELLSPPRVLPHLRRLSARQLRAGLEQAPSNQREDRFATGLQRLFDTYAGTVDAWQVYDNSDFTGPRLLASGLPSETPSVIDATGWKLLKETAHD